MNLSEVTIAGFQLSHLLVAFLIIATFTFVLYWLWTWPCGDQPVERRDEDRVPHETRNAMIPSLRPLYATEIEPGIVVLQSEDGEFFRILREYHTAEKTGNGTTSPELASSDQGNRYMLSYTKAHYQTRASAPLYPPLETGVRSDQCAGGERWKPINTRDSISD
uniref:Uncharacterized protein n=1 Tax=Arion vulgaris TaxID=1028688 RepID=A0A0B6YX20_9EUPU